MLTMPPASDPGTPSTISPSTRSRFLRRRCSRAPSNPSPCPTGALHDPSTALVSLHGAWLDLSTTLADLISTACSDLSATASPQLQTNLTALTADSSHLVFPKMASPTRPMGRDLYRLQEPSYLPLAQEEIVTKSLPGLLRNLKRCQTYSLAKGGQDRAISVTRCCQAQEAMIPRLPAVQSFLASTSSTRVVCVFWWKTKVLDRFLNLFFAPPVAAEEGQMGWETCQREEP